MDKNKSQQLFYNRTSMEGGFFNAKYDILKKLVPYGTSILDLGCYDGRVANFLTRELGCRVDGADISDVNIKKGRSIAHTYIFDFNQKKWPIKRKYDLVIFTDVIEHIFDTDRFMQNVRKLVKTNGHIIFATPNIASIGRRLLLFLGKNPFIEVSIHPEINLFNAPAVGHIRYFTLPTMKSLAEYHGFKITNVVPTPSRNPIINIIGKLSPSLCWHIFIKARKQ